MTDAPDDHEQRPGGGYPPPPPPPPVPQPTADAPPQPPAPQQQPAAPQQPTAPQLPPYAQQSPYPQQPPSAQQPGYPGAAPGQQPYGQPGYPGAAPGQPYPSAQPGGQHPPTGGQPPKKGLGAGVIIAIVAAGLVVLVGVIAIVLIVSRLAAGAPAAGGEGEETGTTTPAGVVQGYLDALAASDAETALSFVDEAVPDSPFLTDEALAASNALGPITDIEVTAPTDADFSARVAASYSVGDVPVTTEFSVNEYEGDGLWKMTAVTAELEFGDRFDGFDMTLNGQPLESSSVVVFPGTYEVATTTPHFAVTGETALTVREPFDYPSLSDTTVTLSAEGVLVFQQAVKDAVAACIASKNFVAGCGIDVPQVLDDGNRLAEGTLTRSLTAEAQAKLDNIQPRETFGEPLLVPGDYIGGINVTAGLEGGGTGDLLFGPSLGAPVVDFTSGTPVVRWD
ncbi:hypothetical protein ACFXP7_05205 [Microbacterium sp. P06]|uniref:hypothetical protein n=1 Tax=Microbacterium sp. P06 TaxID=3366949 RepID=UPI0037459D1D